MVIDGREFKRSALWSAVLTVPMFLLGFFLFDVRGEHAFGFAASIGLAMIYPWVLIHDNGLQYRLGLGSLPLIVLAQWAWCFVPVILVRFIATKFK